MEINEAGIIVEETPERLKITLPVRLNWPVFGLFSGLFVVWLVMLALVLRFVFAGAIASLVLFALLLLWLLAWLWFGRFLWARWQYYAANREILFFYDEQLILRRPVSIFGLTTAYDRRHVSPFYFSDRHSCPAFDYGYQHVYFGHGLEDSAAQTLVENLNQRFFPDYDDE